MVKSPLIRLISILLLGSLLISLPGCNQDRANPRGQVYSRTAEGNSGNETEHTYITVARRSESYLKAFESALSDFNAISGDGTEIRLMNIPQERYCEIMNMLMTSGEGPDVFEVNDELLNTYISKNWLYDLSKYIDNNFLNRFPDWAIAFAEEASLRDEFYTIPSCLITFRLIYNRSLFKGAGLNPDLPPETLPQLKDYAVRISNAYKGEGIYGFALPAGDGWNGFIRSMEAPASYSGIYFYDYSKGEYNIEAYKPWLEAFLDIKREGALFPGELNLESSTARAQFADGNVGMMFASNWDPALLEYEYSTKCDWAVAMPPALDEKKRGGGAVLSCLSSCYAVYSKTKNPDKAFKAWHFLYSGDFVGQLYRSGCEIPVFEEIIRDSEYTPAVKNFNKFIPTKEDSPYPPTPLHINAMAPLYTDEWSRIETYKSALSDEKALDTLLFMKNYKLNDTLGLAVTNKAVDIDDYTVKDFDPHNPLKK